MPSFAAGMPNCALSAAMRRSQASATPTPPPMQKPWIMAMVGFDAFARRDWARLPISS